MPECSCTWLLKNRGSLTVAQKSTRRLATARVLWLILYSAVQYKWNIFNIFFVCNWCSCCMGCHARRETWCLHRAPLTEVALCENSWVSQGWAGGKKVLVKPLKYSVGESKGEAQTPVLQVLPVATPRRGTKPAHINTWLLPPEAVGKPPQRGSERNRAGRSPSGNSGLSAAADVRAAN